MISLIQTAEGALNETHAILQRMRELAVQAANDTNTETDRGELQKEVDQLAQELTRIANNTEFNTQNLLDGTFSDKVIHIGANAGQNLTISINEMSAEALGVNKLDTLGTAVNVVTGLQVQNKTGEAITIKFESAEAEKTTSSFADGTLTITLHEGDNGSGGTEIKATHEDVRKVLEESGLFELVVDTENFAGTTEISSVPSDVNASAATFDTDKGIDISSQDAANSAITVINNAIETVSAERSKLGAYQNRLEHTINNLGTSSENLTAAESRIRDVDYALAA